MLVIFSALICVAAQLFVVALGKHRVFTKFVVLANMALIAVFAGVRFIGITGKNAVSAPIWALILLEIYPLLISLIAVVVATFLAKKHAR